MSENQPIVLIGSSTMNDQFKQVAGFAVFLFACVFLAFLAGMLAGIFKVTPYPTVENKVFQAYKVIQAEAETDNLHFMYRRRNADVGTTVYEADAVQPGVTLISGMWLDDGQWRPSARLLDFSGAVLHEWKVRPEEIWPESPYRDLAAGSHNKPTSYIHGLELLPNGDIIFNIEYLGMVRLNSCGEVVWKLPYRTHHSISFDDAGNIWASGTVWREEADPNYVGIRPPFVDETLVQVSPDGEILQEIFILQSLVDSGYQGTLKLSFKTLDITHMNDVEVLHADMAAAFPMFNAGDILVSLRNLNLVVVVDGANQKVKWHFSHPMIHQHDPDFEADGTITIFDNNDDTTRDGDYWGRSRILKVDPETYRWRSIYPISEGQPFYSQEGGKHQLLPNGNRLITEANTGRIFEVAPDGDTVWNWVIASPDPDYLPEVLVGKRYPADYLDDMACAR